ncbi:Sec1 domain-containing protein 2, variant 2 [Chamberlinius hualienensis]
MSEKLSQINNNWWANIVSKVKNSVVFIDDGAAECLHWNGGILKLLDGGAELILEFSTTQTISVLSQKNALTRCVFILTTPIWSDALETVELILSCRVFTECVIITSAHPTVHHLSKYGSRSSVAAMTKDDPFTSIKDQLLTSMGNKKYFIEILYIPVFTIQICSNCFLTPSYAQLFPIFSSSAGSKHLIKSYDTMAEITFDELKLETQVQLRGLAVNLDSLFDAMNIREDCFSIGCFSRILCNEIEQLYSSKLRRKKAGIRTSVIFIDRTLDLSQATSYDFETLMDKIMHLMQKLPHHQTDVQIDLSSLCFLHDSCINTDVLVSGCLSGSETQDFDTLNSAVNDRHQDCIMKINRKLVGACTKEQLNLGIASKTSRIIADTLQSKVIQFKNDVTLLSNYHCLLQHALAAVRTMNDEEKAKIDQLLGVEKGLTQMLAESQPVNIALRLAQIIKERKTRSLSMEEILLILIRVCAMKDIFRETNESEEILKAVLGDAMLHDYAELPDYLKLASNFIYKFLFDISHYLVDFVNI